MKFYFATCAQLPKGTDDDRILVSELAGHGHSVEFKIWSESHVNWAKADRTIVRTTWDYQKDLPKFLAWAASVPNLHNDAEIIKQNSSKRYLSKTPGAITTIFATNEGELRNIVEKIGAKKLVLKPSVSASAELTFKTSTHQDAMKVGQEILAKRGEIAIQPFIESIATHGEISLIFFDNNFSHALVKKPKSGDFRVQEKLGGTIAPFTPVKKHLEVALKALPRAKYARVDLVDYVTDPKVIELELIEPELFFRTNPNAARNAARALTGA